MIGVHNVRLKVKLTEDTITIHEIPVGGWRYLRYDGPILNILDLLKTLGFDVEVEE